MFDSGAAFAEVAGATESTMNWDGMYFYHIELGEFYGPGSLWNAYSYFRDKYRKIPAMTRASFYIAPSCDFLPKVVRGE